MAKGGKGHGWLVPLIGGVVLGWFFSGTISRTVGRYIPIHPM